MPKFLMPLLSVLLLQACGYGLSIKTASGTPAEERSRQMLIGLIEDYPLQHWTWTRKIVIDETEIPHSHPVLTINPRYDTRGKLMAVFIHEQLHWYVNRREREFEALLADLRTAFPDAPTGRDGGGARDAYSTVLHLAICYLEWDGLRQLLSRQEADEVLHWLARDHYHWIYRQVIDRPDAIGALIDRHGVRVSLP